MNNKHSKKNDILDKSLDEFIKNEESDQVNCEGDECIIKTDKSIIEIVKNKKKIITEDGRQLLI